jgi:prepilin-type N-terminal cleavage/methylation domain-containing protein
MVPDVLCDPRRRRRGMTLVEVVISMTIMATFALGAFIAIQTASRWSMQTAYQSEAYRLAQQKAEELMSGAATFAASSDETITSATSTFLTRNTTAQLAYATKGQTSRVTFTRNVTLVTSSSGFTRLNVNVSWVFASRTYNIQVPVARAI